MSYLTFLDFLNPSMVPIFSDFTTDWYITVAPYFINFLLFGMLSPFISLLFFCLQQTIVESYVKGKIENNKDSKTQMITQK